MLLATTQFTLMTAAYIYGGYQLSQYAQHDDGKILMLSIGAYFIGNALLLGFLKSGSYGVMMMLSALAVLIGNAGISAFVLNERYTLVQGLGIVLAIVAVILIGLEGQGGGAS